jgi:dimethylaniline monooxygenase (N-oxide forming)
VDRVCVIGAGSSGLAACQVLHVRGIDFDCFEAGSEVGGNWRYLNDNGMSSAYRSLHINTSRQLMEFASYPMPADFPVYPDHFRIARYYDDFVKHHGLGAKITFRTEVRHVEPLLDGGFRVTTRNRDTGDEQIEDYRAVIVANGHHWDPRPPEPAFPGSETFTGEQIHSHHYKTPDAFVDKRVLVLGIGNSACDIAVETARVSERTFLAMRRGAHIVPKYLFGMPTDHLTTSWLAAKTPFWFQRLSFGLMLRLARGKVTDYGLPAPDHRVLSAHPTVSDDLLGALGHGDITVKPTIERFDGDQVHFADGSAERIDAVVYCTGYRISFPFLDERVISIRDNEIALYRRVVDPEHEGLYFLGLVQPLGAIMPLAERQAEWVADLIDGSAVLPSESEMRREVQRYRNALAKRYVTSKRHTIEVDFFRYREELSAERRAGRTRARR